jgi:hypothetical protein
MIISVLQKSKRRRPLRRKSPRKMTANQVLHPVRIVNRWTTRTDTLSETIVEALETTGKGSARCHCDRNEIVRDLTNVEVVRGTDIIVATDLSNDGAQNQGQDHIPEITDLEINLLRHPNDLQPVQRDAPKSLERENDPLLQNHHPKDKNLHHQIEDLEAGINNHRRTAGLRINLQCQVGTSLPNRHPIRRKSGLLVRGPVQRVTIRQS